MLLGQHCSCLPTESLSLNQVWQCQTILLTTVNNIVLTIWLPVTPVIDVRITRNYVVLHLILFFQPNFVTMSHARWVSLDFCFKPMCAIQLGLIFLNLRRYTSK